MSEVLQEPTAALPAVFKIPLGSKVKDVTSGYEGIIIQGIEKLNGNIRYVVVPEGLNKDGEPANGFEFDEVILEVLGPGISDRAQPFPTCDLSLGSEVEETVTDFVGILTKKRYNLSGCIECEVVAKMEDTDYGKVAKKDWFDHATVKVLLENQVERPAERSTGSATTRVER
jgi:hypothetical protein